jgi:hypothetical protein
MSEKKTIEQLNDSVLQEVLRARKQWGMQFDLKNTLNDWASYVNIYMSKATTMGASQSEVITNLRKATGLALSALYHAENDLLAPRHYDSAQRPESLPEIENVN